MELSPLGNHSSTEALGTPRGPAVAARVRLHGRSIYLAGSRQPLHCLCAAHWARSWHQQGQSQGRKRAVTWTIHLCCLLWG